MKLLGILLLSLVLSSNARVITENRFATQCGDWKARQTVVVNDKQGNERVLVCLKHNGKYIWRELDNYSSLGEYFNPAKDCTDIAQKTKNAPSGFYWINAPGLKTVTKVWCDLKTNGGGFMLVGYKDSPVSWILPSNNDPVSPDKSAHWSSAFGDVFISEFRIQISTSNDSKDTKADWLYSFSSPRRFTELFMSGEGGCNTHYPGVGSIHYIKDILIDKIVTRNFKCSQFGPTYPSQLGWNMMNRCLREPCNEGFAVFPGINRTRYDNYGAFSYSTSSPRSGVSHNSTAFIGCEHGECCACYGPRGATGNFCAPGCRAINGGTVTNTSHTWFWIRTSIPKKPLWSRCMEFEVQTEQGTTETHFIDGSTGIVSKGSCTQKGLPNIIDGASRRVFYVFFWEKGCRYIRKIVKVANMEALSSIPRVKGMLSYRKDNAKLYLSNGTGWEALSKEAQNKELQNRLILEEKEIARLSTEMKNVTAELEVKVQQLENKLNESKIASESTTAKSCREILLRNPNATSGVHWINPLPGALRNAFGVYCDMKTSGGGWTLVYSYTFTNYNNFYDRSNAVTPRPNWPVRVANVPVSTTPPLDEWSVGALDFNLWKEIGQEILIKSNINDWIVCKPNGGSLVLRKNGKVKCQNIKNVATKCKGVVPTQTAWHKYGPFLSASSVFYDFVQTTKDDWPAHDPCGKRKPNHKKGVSNPGGAILIR